jgi:hypothetical protein
MIEVAPADLVDFGSRYTWGDVGDHRTTVLSRLTGPDVTLPNGELVVCDPFSIDSVSPAVAFPTGTHPTLVCVVGFPEPDGTSQYYRSTAAAVGDVERVAEWRPLESDGAEVRCEIGTGWAVFLDAAHLDSVRDLVGDEDTVLDLADEVSEEGLAVVEWEGKSIGAAFVCSLGGESFHMYGGYDAGGELVSVLVDLELLTRAERRLDA